MTEGKSGLSPEVQKSLGEISQSHVEIPVIAAKEQSEHKKAQGTERAEAARLSEVHEQLASQTDQIPQGKLHHNPLFGDFQNYPLTPEGKIQLPEEQMKPLMERVRFHKRKHRFDPTSYLRGHKTTTKYDNKVWNFRTRTAILPL